MSSHTTRLLLVAVVYQDEDLVTHSLGIQVPGLAVKVHCGADGDLSLQAACHVHIRQCKMRQSRQHQTSHLTTQESTYEGETLSA